MSNFPEKPGYYFMPAAVNPVMTGGMALYVRYHKHNRENIEFAHETANSLLVKAPDRDLLFVRDMHTDNSSRPVDENWDEMLSLSPSSKAWSDFNLDYGMINYVAHMNKPIHPVKRDPSMEGNRTRWLSDSGGFQILTGKIDYIDPEKVAHWYNDNVNIGMSLDIPNPDHQNEGMFWASAAAQKINNDKMFKILTPETDLMNVIHGNDADNFIRFHDMVYDKRSFRLSIAGIYRGTTLDAVSTFVEIMTRLEKANYKHVHILGIFNTRISILLARAARKFFPNIILTSDATSYLMAAHGWEMCMQRNNDKPFERLKVGASDNPAKHPSIHRHLSCSCPICQRIKYTDIIAFSRGIPVYFLQYHNKFEMVRYARNVSQHAETLSDKDYREMAKLIISQGFLKETLAGLDFLESAAQDGYKKARAKFQYYMVANRINPALNTVKVFDHGQVVDTEGDTFNTKHVKKALRIYLGKEAFDAAVHGKLAKSDKIREMHGAHKKKKGHHIVNKVRGKAKGLASGKKKRKSGDNSFHKLGAK